MIPYEELVSALARWRARRGLPTGLGDYLGEPPPAAFDVTPVEAEHGRDDVVELGDDMVESVEEVHGRDYAYGVPDRGDVQAFREAHAAAAAGSIDTPLEADELGVDDFGGPEEATRPAGLAGVTHPAGDAQPRGTEGSVGSDPRGAKGQRRGRRRK